MLLRQAPIPGVNWNTKAKKKQGKQKQTTVLFGTVSLGDENGRERQGDRRQGAHFVRLRPTESNKTKKESDDMKQSCTAFLISFCSCIFFLSFFFSSNNKKKKMILFFRFYRPFFSVQTN